jgi:Zn-dependent peptidase ImmA (M78 family)
MTASTRRHRTRFLISHEIGHTFFYELSARRPRRLLPVGSAAEEEFCTEFARALLIPPEAVAQTPPCADTVFELAQRYDVSVELAARTFAAFHQRQPQVALGYWTKRSRKVMLQWATPMPGSAELLEGGPDQSINRRTRQVVAVALPH